MSFHSLPFQIRPWQMASGRGGGESAPLMMREMNSPADDVEEIILAEDRSAGMDLEAGIGGAVICQANCLTDPQVGAQIDLTRVPILHIHIFSNLSMCKSFFTSLRDKHATVCLFLVHVCFSLFANTAAVCIDCTFHSHSCGCAGPSAEWSEEKLNSPLDIKRFMSHVSILYRTSHHSD